MKTKNKYAALLCGIVSLSSVAMANNAHPANPSANALVQAKAADVKPQDIIDKYIQAIGGKDNIDKIKTIHSTGTATVQGTALGYETKKMSPNKFLIVVSLNGSTVSKQVFDGTTGYADQQGNKKDFAADDIKKYNEVKGLFPQEYYATAGYTLALKGSTKVNDKPAYTIEVTSPSGIRSTEYYDSVSHLLVRQDIDVSSMSVIATFDNYKAVNNVLIPYKLSQDINTSNGEMTIDIAADSITANANDVAETDFK